MQFIFLSFSLTEPQGIPPAWTKTHKQPVSHVLTSPCLRQSSATLNDEKLSHMEWKMEAEIWAGLARFFTYSNKVPVTFYTRVADPGGTALATATNLKESEERRKKIITGTGTKGNEFNI